MQKVILSALLLLLLAACSVGVSRSVSAPAMRDPAIIAPGEPGGPSIGGGAQGGEKVVEMVTQTPTAVQAAVQPTPKPVESGAFIWPTPIMLSGVQMVPYTDTMAGFSFQYPGNWNIIDLTNEQKKDALAYTISLRSPGPTPGPKQMDGIMPGVAAIDISVMRDDPKTLEQAAEERRKSATTDERGPLKILQDESVTLPNGLPAQYFIFQGSDGTTTSMVVTLVNGHTVLIAGFGEQVLFTTVAGTFREN